MQRSLFCCPLSSDVNDVQVFSPLFPNVVSVTSVSGLRVTVERCRIKKKGTAPGVAPMSIRTVTVRVSFSVKSTCPRSEAIAGIPAIGLRDELPLHERGHNPSRSNIMSTCRIPADKSKHSSSTSSLSSARTWGSPSRSVRKCTSSLHTRMA
jgi:hypothetical protein